MIDKLIELGIRDIDIQNIQEFIKEDSIYEFNKIIDLLTSIDCDEMIIRNIIVGNPYVMEKSYEEVFELINYLVTIGFKNINLLLDSYPLILNKDVLELEDYIASKMEKGLTMEDIIDKIESNPLILEEDD